MVDKKEALKILGIAATAGVAAAGAYAYVQYRKAQLDAEAARLWEVLELKPGARVGDVGAGVGNMAVRIAGRAGASGRVFAAEINERRLRKLRLRKQKQELMNIEIVTAAADDCNLPAGVCDAVFLRGAYHHLTNPAAMNASLMRALRPGGALAVIDFPPRLLLKPFTPKGIPSDRGGHGIRREMAERELEAAGFEPVRAIADWDGDRYCIVVQKPISRLEA
ncbi:MAG: class I SAM-dependent methyltransferase [Terriglobales bacterium]